jgi:urease accessory protein
MSNIEVKQVSAQLDLYGRKAVVTGVCAGLGYAMPGMKGGSMKGSWSSNSTIRWMFLLLLTWLIPSLAYANIGVGQTGGVMRGLTHPIMGLDHVAAMVAVGILAAQRGGRAIWAVPLSFMVTMLVGGVLGVVGISIPFVEVGIVMSVLILGLLIAAAVRLPLVTCTILVGLFALFHGHAHGGEMPETASGLAYGIGFVLATGLLHLFGIGVGLMARRLGNLHIVRYAGGATAVLGIYMIII